MSDDLRPRADDHGEDCTMGAGTREAHAQTDERSPLTGRMAVVHCHDCWRYTDDSIERRDLVQSATTVIVNSGTLDVKNSDAFAAADAFLAGLYRAAARNTGMPRL